MSRAGQVAVMNTSMRWLRSPGGALGSLVCLLTACGGTDLVGVLEPDAGGSTVTTDSGPNVDARSPHDAPPLSDAGADGGSHGLIDPLVVGNAWTYDVNELGNYPLCPGGSHVGSVASALQYGGRLAYEVISFCEGLGPYYYSEMGDLVSWDFEGTWETLLGTPVAEGQTWSTGSSTYEWHDVGTVTVPAGSFDECYEAADTAGPSYTVFCRGTGPIHWHYDDGQGNGYDALLTRKNF
jgi:hypothetical protein